VSKEKWEVFKHIEAGINSREEGAREARFIFWLFDYAHRARSAV